MMLLCTPQKPSHWLCSVRSAPLPSSWRVPGATGTCANGRPKLGGGPSPLASRSGNVPGQARAGRNIVLAADSSIVCHLATKDSKYALEWTMANMYRKADTIHLLHCVPTVPRDVMFVHVSPLGNTQYAPAPLLVEDKHAMEAATEFVERVYCSRMDASGVQYKVTVVLEEGAAFGGGVGDKICETVDRVDAAAVVVGAHRKSALAEFIMGSISNFLVHQCSVPVAVLHAPRAEARDDHMWSMGPRNIAIAVDTSERAESMCKWTVQNIAREGDHLHFLHVVSSSAIAPMYKVYAEGMVTTVPGPSPEDLERTQQQLHDDLEQRMHALSTAAGPLSTQPVKLLNVEQAARRQPLKRAFILAHTGIKKATVHSIPEDVSRPLVAIGSAICKTCEELDAAALVTMSGHKGPIEELFMGSVTSYLAHHCESPVLVLS